MFSVYFFCLIQRTPPVLSHCLVLRKDSGKGVQEEAGCEGVNPGRGGRVCGGYSALMGLLVSVHPCSCAN